MHRWKTHLFNFVFSLNCLLLFLVLFEQKLQVPVWLQVVGRMHPLILHFPIVLLVLTVFWELLPRKQKEDTINRAAIGDSLLLAAAFTSVLTSLIGLFLSREDGYVPEVLLWHKWGGVFISLLTIIWYAFRHRVRQAKSLLLSTTAIGLGVIVVTGHQGANITHGENFLLAPLSVEDDAPPVLLEDAVVYTHMVKPILETKCAGCHNRQKAKGELLMDTEAALVKGGKSGPLWDTTEKDFGLLFQRIHLPLENKKHMPPKGKPQLTDEEIVILHQWVKGGANFTKKVTDLPETDTLRMLATGLFSTIETDQYAFEAADEKEIQKQNTTYRVVAPLAVGSPALSVNFFSTQAFNATALADLQNLKDQVVTLNLSKMPVADSDLKTIAQFKNLRKLNLSFTNITGAALPELAALTQLRQLSLSGTSVEWKDVQILLALPKLSCLYLWNTRVSADELAKAALQYKKISFESGYKGDTVVLKLNPPLLENEEQIVKEPVPLKLRHGIKGVTIRYTTNGTEPDSLSSPAFGDNLLIDKNMVIKAKAYKQGWISSDVVESQFYKAGYKPDTVLLIKAPDPLYKGDGAATLTDTEKGDQNFRSGKWLGYKEGSLTAMMQFKKPVTLSVITVSSLINIGSYILPPSQVEVWGGSSASNLRLLQRSRPPQPKGEKPSSMEGFEFRFKPAEVSVVKVVVTPVTKIPSWHPGRGQRAWVFVDEILLN